MGCNESHSTPFEHKKTFYETYKFNRNNSTIDEGMKKWLLNRSTNQLENDHNHLDELIKANHEKLDKFNFFKSCKATFLFMCGCDEDSKEHNILIEALAVLLEELRHREFKRMHRT